MGIKMSKIADKYFFTAPWEIIESGFDESYSKVSESVFSLGNEYMGVRGYFEEGYSGETLMGSYFNGVYESEKLQDVSYKGIITDTEFMVNSVNWLACSIQIEEETLDLKHSSFKEYRRVLDMKNGVLTRSFIWRTQTGKEIQLQFERFLSMVHENLGVQKISLLPLNFDGKIELYLDIDFAGIHKMYHKNYWNCLRKEAGENRMEIEASTMQTGAYLFSGSYIQCSKPYRIDHYTEDKKMGMRITIDGQSGQWEEITRFAWNDRESNEFGKRSAEDFSYRELLEENKTWWKHIWEKSDIEIRGDEENQQGIRFCIFQMFQTYHGARPGNNIGAKGLTGEAYNGNAFWDTETYCLPFFIFNHPQAAKSLLMFRYRTLEDAKARAKDLDCRGAFYPIATISGKECCNLWQHASLQLQASTGVAYGIWAYDKIMNDKEFLYNYGIRMLIEISRMLADRGDWSADGRWYGYYGVMGPDEFQIMVNHNYYTNAMGKFTLEYTSSVLQAIKKEDAVHYRKLETDHGISSAETEDWRKKAEHMLLLYDKETQLFEQHDGYFKLPHVDVKEIPIEEFPLYHNWTYDRIYRNDMIKQPDVLMIMLLFNHAYTEDQIRANYEFYEPKCIHESSLSPSVHSILASQLKKKEEAYEFFRFATRMDLDNYNRNTEEGLHTTSIAAAWMNIVYGFGGMRSDGDKLSFSPSIPVGWETFSFRIHIYDKLYQNNILIIEVMQENIRVSLLEEGQIEIKIYEECYTITKQGTEINIPLEWR